MPGSSRSDGEGGESQGWRDPVNPLEKGKSGIIGNRISRANIMEKDIAERQLQSLTKSMVHNPCFEFNSNFEDDENDEVALSELKKRKRGGRVHGDVEPSVESGRPGSNDDRQDAGEDASLYFLSAGPGDRACRGQ